MRERSREPARRTLAVNANSLDIYEHVYVINFYDGSDNGIGGAIRLSRPRRLGYDSHKG